MSDESRNKTTAPSPPYEKADVAISGIVWFTVILTLATAAAMLLMVWMFRDFERRQVAEDAASLPPTRLQDALPKQPPAPVLQGSPGSNFELQSPLLEMEAWDRKMDAELATSGWIDRNEGTVRIPIERAKQLLLERGLPVRSDPAGDPR